MTATQAQVRDVKIVMDTMRQHAPRGAIKALTPEARAVVLTDWLTQHVGLTGPDLEHLGNYLCRQAWAMDRDLRK